MKTITFQDTSYASFVRKMQRRALPTAELYSTVSSIITDVEKRGNKALIEYTKKFDRLTLTEKSLFVTPAEISTAEKNTAPSVKAAIAASLANIHTFAHKSMRKDWSTKNAQGVTVGERFTPYPRVGVYVPGGKAPLVSTALMTAGIAQAVGVPQILAATPAGPDGTINPALLYALSASGCTEIIKVGGAQAIAAMALGTKTITPALRIFGPGNPFVVEAKRQLVGAVSIDLLPGPSEILILADHTANPTYIAADMLAQAEHGGDSSILLLTDSPDLLENVKKQIAAQLTTLTRATYISGGPKKSTFLVLTKNTQEAITLANSFAPEHLTLIHRDQQKILPQITSSGAIFLGNDSPVAIGDFLAGPSHTLPTGGSGASFSGIRADQFQRRTSIISMDKKAVKKSLPHITEFTKVEGLDAHARSVSIRLDNQ